MKTLNTYSEHVWVSVIYNTHTHARTHTYTHYILKKLKNI